MQLQHQRVLRSKVSVRFMCSLTCHLAQLRPQCFWVWPYWLQSSTVELEGPTWKKCVKELCVSEFIIFFFWSQVQNLTLFCYFPINPIRGVTIIHSHVFPYPNPYINENRCCSFSCSILPCHLLLLWNLSLPFHCAEVAPAVMSSNRVHGSLQDGYTCTTQSCGRENFMLEQLKPHQLECM